MSGGKQMTKEQIKAEENMIRAEVTMAVQQSKNVGELPSDIKQIITEMERSQVDWSSVIRRVVGGDQPEDYTYRRPNRRSVTLHGYIQSKHIKKFLWRCCSLG